MVNKDAIANAEAERDALLGECQQMLLQISRRYWAWLKRTWLF